jgi:hypothetical protein
MSFLRLRIGDGHNLRSTLVHQAAVAKRVHTLHVHWVLQRVEFESKYLKKKKTEEKLQNI